MADRFTSAKFRDGEVVRVDAGSLVYYIKVWETNLERFDVVTLNHQGFYCDRRYMGRNWVQDLLKRTASRDIEWSSDTDYSARQYWPKRVDHRPPDHD